MQLVSTKQKVFITCSGVGNYWRRHEVVRKGRIGAYLGRRELEEKNPINIPSLSRHYVSKLFSMKPNSTNHRTEVSRKYSWVLSDYSGGRKNYRSNLDCFM